MGFRLSGQLLETKTGLTPAQKLILLGLAERSDKSGSYAFPSVATLATYAECSERNVELGLKHLVMEGWIGVQRKATNRLPTTYQINLAKLFARRGEDSSPQHQNHTETLNENDVFSGRGEDSSPQDIRGAVSSPQGSAPEPRGEVFGIPGANFSASRGEESSPDPVTTEPIPEPIQHTHGADAPGFVLTGPQSDPLSALKARFERVWHVYPRGAAKKPAWEQFQKIHPTEPLTLAMIAAIEHQKRTVWGGVEPRRIPHLRTWLFQERWTDADDDVAPVSQAEFDTARRILSAKYIGRCPHRPICESQHECVKVIALREREHNRRGRTA